jgi:hypothetical protein
MPYSSIPTVTDGQVLSASFLNQLSSNHSFIRCLFELTEQ